MNIEIHDSLELGAPNKRFEEIKEIDENGIEYWRARKLMQILEYSTWRRFEDVIKKAKNACVRSGQFPWDHFVDIGKMTEIGSGVVRKLDDFKLDRYACYLIAQNGDPTKQAIAMAQTYFAVQTRRQEMSSSVSDIEKRVSVRAEVADKNKKLFSTAKTAGVSNFGLFNDAGYRGLYGITLRDIENLKNIPKGQLLNYAGSEELGANLFRITQTEAKIKREKIRGDLDSRRTHFDVGNKVRKTIKELGGEMPENLKPEKHIRLLKKDLKLTKAGTSKKLG